MDATNQAIDNTAEILAPASEPVLDPKNAAVQEMMSVAARYGFTWEELAGVFMVASIAAVREHLKSLPALHRGGRMKILRKLVVEFELKLRRYTNPVNM